MQSNDTSIKDDTNIDSKEVKGTNTLSYITISSSATKQGSNREGEVRELKVEQ